MRWFTSDQINHNKNVAICVESEAETEFEAKSDLKSATKHYDVNKKVIKYDHKNIPAVQ